MKYIVAHRGLSSKAPENTLESFDLAILSGVTHIEFDVHLSKDNEDEPAELIPRLAARRTRRKAMVSNRVSDIIEDDERTLHPMGDKNADGSSAHGYLVRINEIINKLGHIGRRIIDGKSRS